MLRLHHTNTRPECPPAGSGLQRRSLHKAVAPPTLASPRGSRSAQRPAPLRCSPAASTGPDGRSGRPAGPHRGAGAPAPRPLRAPASSETSLAETSNLNEEKVVVWVRHSTTEMNEWLGRRGCGWGAPGFRDALLWDTRLSPSGLRLARALNRDLRRAGGAANGADFGAVELCCVSPLTRALQTASIGLDGLLPPHCHQLALPMARERLYLSSDVGRARAVLADEYPHVDFSLLPAAPPADPAAAWWYQPGSEEYAEWRPEGEYGVPGEPAAVFHRRMCALREWLGARPEQVIAVVAHWGVIKALTGKSMENCGILKMKYADLLETPQPDGADA